MSVAAIAAPPKHHHGFLRFIGAIIFLIVLMAGFQTYSSIALPTPSHCTPPQCKVPPPVAQPLRPQHVYTSSKYGFSLEYPNEVLSPGKVTNSSISWDGTFTSGPNNGDEVAWSISGTPPNGLSDAQIVDQIQSANFPDARPAYQIPDAAVGYTLGAGEIYDLESAPANGVAVHERVVIMVAQKKGLAIIVEGFGPYHQTTPRDGGHPDPASTPFVGLSDFTEPASSVIWPGDSPL